MSGRKLEIIGANQTMITGELDTGLSREPGIQGGVSARLKPILFCGLGDGWNEYPGRQMLLHALAKHTPVVLLRWRQGEESRWSQPKAREVQANIFEVQNAFAFRTCRLRKLGPAVGWVDGRRLQKLLGRMGMGDFVYWLSVGDPKMLWGMPTKRLVYDCVDPCFMPEQQAHFDRDEFAVARRAKLVFCTAHTLFERLRVVNKNCHLLPNACSQDTYERSEKGGGPLPAALDGRSRPFIGYMGTMDWRFDCNAVAHAARTLPGYTFVMVGRVNADQYERLAPLRALANVVFTGSVSREEGLIYTSAFDVGLIPFIPGEMNDAINPVKMYMYLVAGKPVVSTKINECSLNSEFVDVGRSDADFAEKIRHAVESNSEQKRAERVRFGLANRWKDRAEEAIRVMDSRGLFA